MAKKKGPSKWAAFEQLGRTNSPDGTHDTSAAERGRRNKQFGTSTERAVAKITGGERTVGSGAIKTSNRNLTGDVEIRDADNAQDIIKIEVKGVSSITPSGDKTFILKKSVLDQAMSEADVVKEVGVVWLHWKNASYGVDDYAILSSTHFLQFLEWAKIGAAVERRGELVWDNLNLTTENE